MGCHRKKREHSDGELTRTGSRVASFIVGTALCFRKSKVASIKTHFSVAGVPAERAQNA